MRSTTAVRLTICRLVRDGQLRPEPELSAWREQVLSELGEIRRLLNGAAVMRAVAASPLELPE